MVGSQFWVAPIGPDCCTDVEDAPEVDGISLLISSIDERIRPPPEARGARAERARPPPPPRVFTSHIHANVM